MRSKLRRTCAGDVNPRIIDRPLRAVCRRCASDYEGTEIKRQLNGFAEEFALAVHDEALGARADGSFARTWEHPMSRRIATEAIFLAYSCDESTFRGKSVWRVRGFTVRTIGLMATVRWNVNAKYDDAGKVIGPHVNTISRDLGKLRMSGILLPEGTPHAHQFDARKLIAQGLGWCVGPPKTNADGSPMLDKNGDPMQYASNHYYLTLCPFAPHTRSRCRPGRFDYAFRSQTAGEKYPAPEAATTMGRMEAAKEQAKKRRDAKLLAQLKVTDAARLGTDIDFNEGDFRAARFTKHAAAEQSPRSAAPSDDTPCWEDPEYMARMIAQANARNGDPPDPAD